MKRTLLGMAEAGEPLLRQALEAIRAYNEAIAQRRPEADLDRLRIEADHLYQIVINYQLHKAGTLGEPVH
ncbi:hypothetical protein LVV80_17920 [Pseudomonas sp. KCA11]|uniref:hypothetical protein n=1 Tax=Pseudomonas sp. KCA11 TaxID=2899114 RepID=UPI001F259471|nr:hypothetical protein [Pseudomonas sp. KCA11]MCE5993876.1 hypothetical protein [Pseudomonas sp. KCA11]